MTTTAPDPHETDHREAGWIDVTPELLDDLIADQDGAMNDHYCFMGDDDPYETTITPTTTQETI